MLTSIRRGAALLALMLSGLLPPIDAQAEIRWVRNIDNEPGSCQGLNGYSNIQLALIGLPPGEHHEIRISHRYVHREIANLGREVLIDGRINNAQGSITLSGGWECAGITAGRPAGYLSRTSQRSLIAAIGGEGPVLRVEFARRVILDRITVRGARRTRYPDDPLIFGAGMSVLGLGHNLTQVDIRNSLFEDNRNWGQRGGALGVHVATVNLWGTSFIGNEAQYGGAIHVSPYRADLLIAEDDRPGRSDGGGFVFSANRAFGAGANGGAIHFEDLVPTQSGSRLILGGDAPAGSPTLLFEDNSAHGRGGAVYAGAGTTLDVAGPLQFKANRADIGGAIALRVRGDNQEPRLDVRQDELARLPRPRFEANTAGIEGGALSCESPARNRSAIELGSAEFVDNRAALRGGAIYALGCRLIADRPGADRLFHGNQVTVGKADPNKTRARGGGAVYLEWAGMRFGQQAGDRSLFRENRVPRDTDWGGATCNSNPACTVRALSGGAVMVWRNASASFYNARFVSNVAPMGGAIAAVDAELIVDQSPAGCGTAQAPCPEFRGNEAHGADYIDDSGSAGDRAAWGYGAAIAYEHEGANHGVRIQRASFLRNASFCPAGHDCSAANPLFGRVLHVQTNGNGNLNVRGNLFAGNRVPNTAGHEASGSVMLHANRANTDAVANVAQNTLVEACGEVRAPLIGSNGRALNLVGNLVLFEGCASRIHGDTRLVVAACNLNSRWSNLGSRLDPNALVQSNILLPAGFVADELFVAPAAGNYRLADTHDLAIDVCGNELPQGSIAHLLQNLDRDLDGKPRPVFDPAVDALHGPWDVGAFERQPVSSQLLSDGFE